MPFSLFGSTEDHHDMTMNIQQGEYYKKVNRCFTDSGRIHMAPLQLTSAPYLSSISEEFDDLKNIKDEIEAEFNHLLYRLQQK